MATYNDAFSVPLHPSSPQSISLIGLLFPGLNTTLVAFQQLLAGDLNSCAGLLGLCGLVAFAARYFYRYLKGAVRECYTSTLYISEVGEARDMLDAWTSRNFGDSTRSSRVLVGQRDDYYGNEFATTVRKKPLRFSFWEGKHWFRHQGRWFQYQTVKEQGNFGNRQLVYLSCFGRSQQPLRELFHACRAEYLKQIEQKTLIFENRDGGWQKTKTRKIRRLQTVVLDEEVKQSLVHDIQDFLSLGTHPRYLEGDVPYRRGYLLHGPPGTGKTSAVLALASHFGLDVYKLNLASSVDDGQLSKLFDDLPGRCIVLLEDVDANKAAQRRLPDSDDHGGFSRGGVKAGGAGGSLTLTGLLNAIDGVSSVEGQLLVMTTNHPEKLDEALIRPGRTDRRVEFGYATKDVIFQLFCNFFMDSSTDTCGESPTEYNSSVAQLGIQLSSKVPGEEFTPAEVQSLFLENMQSPDAAMKNADQWMIRVRQEREA